MSTYTHAHTDKQTEKNNDMHSLAKDSKRLRSFFRLLMPDVRSVGKRENCYFCISINYSSLFSSCSVFGTIARHRLRLSIEKEEKSHTMHWKIGVCRRAGTQYLCNHRHHYDHVESIDPSNLSETQILRKQKHWITRACVYVPCAWAVRLIFRFRVWFCMQKWNDVIKRMVRQ